MSYVDEIQERVISQNPAQPEFHQSVRQVLESIRFVIEADEDRYRRQALLERLTTPERIIIFRVPWIDDEGQVQISNGYRVQFNSAIGPYKGGLAFRPDVNLSIVKFMGFEQIFKNALTGFPLGGGFGGSDFDRTGKSERVVMSFCQSYMTELYRHIGINTDIPACGPGVHRREVGFMYGQYKRLSNNYEGVFTCKRLSFGGTLGRTEATGYGLVYMTEELLKSHGTDLKGKTVSVSGAGNVAIYAIEKAQQLGAKVVTCCDSTGWIYDPDGIDLALLKEVKEVREARLTEYKAARPSAEYREGYGVWTVKTDVALPCAARNELHLEDAKKLVANGVTVLCEGATNPCVPEAIRYLQDHGVLFIPSKAANAGGMSSSGLEMIQNAERMAWTFEEVDTKLKMVMADIFHRIDDAARQYGKEGDYVAGANIGGFLKVLDAMEAQGIV